MSRPNLYKFNQIILHDAEARVIDSNERMAERIAQISQSLQESMEDEGEEFSPDEFTDGIEATQVSALLDEGSGTVIKAAAPYEGPSPEEMIAEANEQASALLSKAQADAEQIRVQAREEAMAAGHREGYDAGYREAMEAKERLEQEYAQKNEQLTAVYQNKLREIEPSLMDVLTDVYEHIFRVELAGQRDVVVHLLENALHKIEGANEYLIHVSPEDLPFVSMQKEALMEAGGVANVNFDIVEDMTLSKNQCLIETENGIFDCSLGVELKELKRQLMLLSFGEGMEQETN